MYSHTNLYVAILCRPLVFANSRIYLWPEFPVESTCPESFRLERQPQWSCDLTLALALDSVPGILPSFNNLNHLQPTSFPSFLTGYEPSCQNHDTMTVVGQY